MTFGLREGGRGGGGEGGNGGGGWEGGEEMGEGGGLEGRFEGIFSKIEKLKFLYNRDTHSLYNSKIDFTKTERQLNNNRGGGQLFHSIPILYRKWTSFQKSQFSKFIFGFWALFFFSFFIL